MKLLTDKEVEKNQKRYEAYVLGKTTETLIDSFLMLTTTAVGMFLPIKNVEALQKELRNDYIITNQMSTLDGNLALKYHTVVDDASIMVLLLGAYYKREFKADKRIN